MQDKQLFYLAVMAADGAFFHAYSDVVIKIWFLIITKQYYVDCESP